MPHSSASRAGLGLAREAQLGAMADGLAVHGNCADVLRLLARLAQQLGHALRVKLRQLVGGQGFAFDLVGAGSLQGHQSPRAARRERDVSGSQRGDRRPVNCASAPSTPSRLVPDIRPIYKAIALS
jgi:hypothetical protein